MENHSLLISYSDNKLSLKLKGEFNLYIISKYQQQIEKIDFTNIKYLHIDLDALLFLDTATAIWINNLISTLSKQNIHTEILCSNKDILGTLKLVKEQIEKSSPLPHARQKSFIYSIGEQAYSNYTGFLLFMAFIGELFAVKLHYLKSIKNIRFKEIAFEMNESAIKALGIIALTSFLIGLVVAYQSAYQLKIYGANIFIVDMLGLSILRELSPLITAIVIAGRSGSAFTAQIGAMKITEELDAMRTMGFDPYLFLVLPRIIALMIAMPVLIFVSDMMAISGGILVAQINLDITPELFLERFNNVIDAKHFFVGIVKGPFFAFLIASIGIYRGLMVKNDTQSIGLNTTKSVVESIFAVIVCDAVFSIAFTNLGI
ncbi:ABC transporter permease [bacterium]|nr:ABC transporter permease [bacterium]MBU1990762.1 ABC transporter permease [bacterium]